MKKFVAVFLKFAILIVIFVFAFGGEDITITGSGTANVGDVIRVKLRSFCLSISSAEVKKMITQEGFFDKYWNNSGVFKNQYESAKIKNDQVVIDHATGLIWHQSGSKDFLNLKEAKEWITELNNKEYAGKNTWRLPTLEEALSLMENKKMNDNLYIDPAFDSWQWCILTGDLLDSNKSWLVAFSGRVDWFDSNVRINYIRPVCSN